MLVFKQLYHSTLITTHVCFSFLSSIEELQGIPASITTSCFHPILQRTPYASGCPALTTLWYIYRKPVYHSSLLQERSTRELILLILLEVNS